MCAFPKRKLNVQFWDFPKIQNCCILGKSRTFLVKFSKKSAELWQNLQRFVKNQQKIQQFLMKKLRLENGQPGAKERIV